MNATKFFSRITAAAAIKTLATCIALFAGLTGPVQAHPPRLSAAPAGQSAVTPVAVFGKDTRRSLNQRLKPLRRSIGLIYNNNARSVCTGFCVAPNIVATAAHCLFRTAGERLPRLRGFRFILRSRKGQPSSPIAGHRTRNPAQFIVAGSRKLRVEPPIDATKDWALMKLEKSICRGGELEIADSAQAARSATEVVQPVLQVSFHHDFANWKLAFSGACELVPAGRKVTRARLIRDFAAPESLLLHSCDTGGASSGSPLLTEGADGRLRVIAINVGTYIQTRMLVENGKVVRRFKSDAIANTAVTGDALRNALRTFERADILGAASDMRRLQKELQARGFYHGSIDGAFGPATRQAIQAFRGIPGQDTAGLPTRALLSDLVARSKGAPAQTGTTAGNTAPVPHSKSRQHLTRGRLDQSIKTRQ